MMPAGRIRAPTDASGQSAPDLGLLLPLVNSGRHAELEARVRELLEQHPDSGPLWKILGLALWSQGKDALPALESAAALLPADAEAQCNVGNALRSRGRLEEAAAWHERAIAIDARYAEAHNNLGSVLRDLGRLEEAASSYRRALAIKPDYAMAHHNLGLALQGLGRATEALASVRRAVVMQPAYADAHASMGRLLEQSGRFDEAVKSFRRALEGRPADAALHRSLGNASLRLRRLEDAVESYGRSLEIDPGSAMAHNNLGHALRELGRIEAAIQSYRRALELEPEAAEIHVNLGNVLVDVGAWEQAVDRFRRALEIKPSYAKACNALGNVLRLLNRSEAAEAAYRRGLELDPESAELISSLGDHHADLGAFDQAEASYRRAIAVDAGFSRAWAGIASLRKMSADDAEWLAGAERFIQSALLPREEVHLRYAMGKYFDDVRDYDRAFENYRRANELTQSYRPPHDRTKLRQTFDMTMTFYDAEWLHEACVSASEPERPVFIIGMPRSGTSLAEQILASHPAVFGAGELPFWNLASSKVAAAALRGEAPRAAVAALAEEYLTVLRGRSTDALRVTDKMPGNFAHVGLIHAAFPQARFVHMSRDPVDTCLSIYFQNFHLVHSYTNDLDDLAHYYREYLRIMDHWRSILPGRQLLDVPYEALIDDPETWSRRLVDFVGLPWDPACLDFHRTVRSVSTFSRWQVRQTISKASVQRWRNYSKHVDPLMPLLKAAEAAITDGAGITDGVPVMRGAVS